jgi:hypothetical protein
MMGMDPRTHASRRHGKEIIDFEVKKMKSVIDQELSRLQL